MAPSEGLRPLNLPASGSAYLDTSAIIYSVERNEPYLTLWEG